MASKRSKPKNKRSTETQFDLEAIGLVLLALGIFIIGVLIPRLPTGDIGRSLREALTGRVGWGAYVLPWPALVLGGLFLLRRSPRAWPRVLAGYLMASLGLWFLLILARPEVSGIWGQGLRAYVAGATGWLAYLLALFIFSLGLELILAWRPTRILRTLARWGVQALRRSFKLFMRWRSSAKKRAAFYADVTLARAALKDLKLDLSALSTLYPGSAELDKWRKAIKKSELLLSRADKDILADVQADTAAWQNAVAGFAKDRAGELSVSFKAEGIDDFANWHNGLKAQLADPIDEAVRIARPLDDIRKALALDLTALLERYRRLTRERDLAETALREMKPRALAQAFEQHHARLKNYGQVLEARTAFEQEVDLLELWRDLSAKLLRLSGEFPDGEELKDYSETLAAELREKRREALVQFEGWQKALQAVELRLRQPPTSPEMPDDKGLADIEDEALASAFGEVLELAPVTAVDAEAEMRAQEPSLQEQVSEAAKTAQTKPGQTTAEDLSEIGGIPLQLPDYELLDEMQHSSEDPVARAREVQERIDKIDDTLANFKLQGRVVASVRGPTVTRFEVEPAPGEKISRFANLSDDLALAMAVGSVRIEAPIPGKSVIGLEVPNTRRDVISFREAAESASFKRSKARLPLILGKSIDGEMIVGDLAKMPHLLIAGSTGSGKSVAVNTLIGSLLYKYLPTELRFVMIDPKMVELTPFDGIPHLVRSVVTNPNDAAGVLLGAVAHMERRYKMMSKIGAKNLDQYNQKARNLDLPQLPFMAIIIDELADLMITSPKEVESAIMRLAQMARATGMHLVLATQRPSVDILTSLIKVNVPARVAFAVSSGHDSRTILDTMGAERLTGMGDMLFYQPGLVKPVRLQGPFIGEGEIHALGSFLRRQYFDDDFVEAYGNDFDPPPADESSASGMIDWNDDKLREAAELVVNEGQASVSRLQRRLSVGHARAGKLMDSLEALAVVGPHQGSKPREVLVAPEELPNIFGK